MIEILSACMKIFERCRKNEGGDEEEMRGRHKTLVVVSIIR